MRYIPTILMLVLVLAIIAGSVYYISSRLAIYFPIISRKVWLTIVSTLILVILISISVFSTTPNPVASTIFMFSGVMVGIIIFLILSLIATDLIHVIFRISTKMRCILTFGFSLILTIYGIWNAYYIRVNELTIPISGLTHEIRALHITDVHLGNFRGKGQVERLANIVKELNLDVIFNTGDMFDSKNHFVSGEDVLSPLAKLNIPHFFVYGNHDDYVGVETVIDKMRKAGCTVLLNEVTQFGELQIVGLNNMLPDSSSFDPHAKPGSLNIDEVLNKLEIKEKRPTILLHHRPDGVDYMQKSGVDLLLSGHTHGGQLFPITIISKLMFGYNSGLYKFKDMTIHVSEGIGTIFSPIRLGTNSGITLIHLVPDNR